ncbi:hypothetical protein THAOC_29669, partial [Thalassiosira oceanica]
VMKYLSTLRNKDSVRGGELDRLSQANMGSSFVATCRWNHAFTHPDGEHRTVGFANPELVHAVMQKGLTLNLDATFVTPKNWIAQGDGYSGDEVQRVQDWPTEAPRVQESRAASDFP